MDIAVNVFAVIGVLATSALLVLWSFGVHPRCPVCWKKADE